MIQPGWKIFPRWKLQKKYIAAAKEAGLDAVKFQSYKADTIVSKILLHTGI